eukprot:4532651-Ditylum_brightwellii.AAC.1
MYVPEVHDIPSVQRAVVPYAAYRNPYASSYKTQTSQQKVSHYPITASTGGHVPSYTLSTCPPAQDTTSAHNLMDGIDFESPFFPYSTCDTGNNDTFCIITALSSRIFTYVIVDVIYMLHM